MIGKAIRLVLTVLLLVPVYFYQLIIGPLLPKMCPFYPSCSHYFIQAVTKHGPVRGALKGIGRVCRCHPWSQGGYDPP
jgi:putative membrane protein insertion efficiency factor